MIGFNSATFIPLAAAIFILVLSAMEYVARFEIRRTNAILGTDFRVVDNWFGSSFLSWDGVKERITSLRVWLAVAYVFISFGWSIFSFLLVVLGISGLLITLLAVGVIALSNFTRSFEFVDNGDFFRGNISFNELNARAMAEITEGFLSGTYLPKVEEQIAKWKSGKKVSERDIREAMKKESLQPQISELSNREREILALMAQGKSNAGIAKTLYITEGSVEKHISNILSKLELKTGDENHRRVLAVLAYLGIDPNGR